MKNLKDRGTIMIVEDSVHARNIIEYIVKQNGFQVLSFSNGEECWKHVSKNTQLVCRAIITDIMMPSMDGITLVEKLSTLAGFKMAPVAFLSASNDKDYIAKAKQLKASAYLLKPISASRVIQCLKKLLPGEKFIEIKVGA